MTSRVGDDIEWDDFFGPPVRKGEAAGSSALRDNWSSTCHDIHRPTTDQQQREEQREYSPTQGPAETSRQGAAATTFTALPGSYPQP